ncbi:hypothetical protein BCR39DRAFT_473921 [Naematelia encephala]|uniref:Uncharacterized protein n=1 Tax=Naematelia encephala TaxID=71784 RepID=A0A1Y2AJQ3_9TREE|nr:hypothetical protein BCR39DRAFT_473921 [Naematelia encephala]
MGLRSCLEVLFAQRASLPKEPEKLAPSTPAPSTSTSNSTPSRRSYHDVLSFDLSSLVGGRDSKSPKYPEKLLKVLDTTLQRIAMGQEPKFSDQRFRRTAASFWSTTWPDKTFQRQMRESRKIEDLILPFVTSATKSLKKEDELVDGAWKFELNTQIALFLDLLADSLNAVGPIPGELSTRLESYRARLRAPEPNGSSSTDARSSDRGHGEKSDVESVRSVRRDIEGLKGRETEGVAQLFGMTEDDLASKLKELQSICTEQAALEDLKVSKFTILC